MGKAKKRKQNSKSIRKTLPSYLPGEYPFLNPIIVTCDDFIIDGQHRYDVCNQMGRDVKVIKLNFTKDQAKSNEFIEEVRKIKEQQRIVLENFFIKGQIGYKMQIDLCASDDKIFYLYKYKDKFKTDVEFTQYLSSAYTSSSNTYLYRQELKELFTSKRIIPEHLMNEEDLNYFKKLPHEFTIYRGMSKEEFNSKDFGFSWTLDRKIANFFANDYIHNYNKINESGLIYETRVQKKNVIAFFDERKEKEIIYID